MANHKSALKRARQGEATRVRNLIHKSKAKTAVKDLRALLADKKTGEAINALKDTACILQRSASKGVMHKKKASRKISRLARAVNRAVVQKSA